MKKNIMNKLLISAFLTTTLTAYGNTVYQFENGMPKNFSVSKTSKISLTEEKAKDGTHSLKWKFKGNDRLTIKGDTEYTAFDPTSKEKARSSYAMWVYNKKPINDIMKIEFKKQGETKCSFDMNMNFEGWRTMWVQYDRDMNGTAEVGMDEIVLTAPKTAGEILIDQLYPSPKIDPRHNARDEQVDFVNLNADTATNAHWMALYLSLIHI